MAYLLFRDHNMTPSQYYDLGANERAMLRAFIRQEWSGKRGIVQGAK